MLSFDLSPLFEGVIYIIAKGSFPIDGIILFENLNIGYKLS